MVRDARQTCSLLLATAALLASGQCFAVAAWAQERQPAASEKQPGECDGGPRRGGEHRSGFPLGRFPGGYLFRPGPEDEGPLDADERAELLRFVRKRVPRVYRSLIELRRRDPAAFEQRLQEAAPRLRQVRRIFRRDPQLGNNIIRHAENLQLLRRARQAWLDGEHDPEMRSRVHTAARQLIAENLRIELGVLTDLAQQLEQGREERIQAEIERLLSSDVESAGASEEKRRLVELWWDTQTDDERAALRAELRQLCSEQLDREIARLRRRVARISADAVEEVDRRMERLTSPPERGPRNRAGRARELDDDRESPSKRRRRP